TKVTGQPTGRRLNHHKSDVHPVGALNNRVGELKPVLSLFMREAHPALGGRGVMPVFPVSHKTPPFEGQHDTTS
ncbi:MAG: hypothetical protein DRJ61_17855, partial [Acidobacteria bacterium]